MQRPSPNVRFSVWTLTDTATMTLMGDVTGISPDGPRLLLTGLESVLLESPTGRHHAQGRHLQPSTTWVGRSADDEESVDSLSGTQKTGRARTDRAWLCGHR